MKNTRVNVLSTIKSFLVATMTVALLSFIGAIEIHAADTLPTVIKAQDQDSFYREAVAENNKTKAQLNGFPTSSQINKS